MTPAGQRVKNDEKDSTVIVFIRRFLDCHCNFYILLSDWLGPNVACITTWIKLEQQR